MNSTTSDRFEPDLIHPWWCSPTACRAAEPAQLDESGDLALSSRGTEHHYGDRVAVPRQKFDEVLLSAQLAADGMEADAPVTVDLTLTRTVFDSIEGYTLTGRQARELVVMLGSLLPALMECGELRRREDVLPDCPAWCTEPASLAHHGVVGHSRTTGGVEMLGHAFDVQVAQSGAGPASVTLFEHADDNTSVTTFSPGEAVELALALLGAAGLAGGAR